jgi:hypothetical protein
LLPPLAIRSPTSASRSAFDYPNWRVHGSQEECAHLQNVGGFLRLSTMTLIYRIYGRSVGVRP